MKKADKRSDKRKKDKKERIPTPQPINNHHLVRSGIF
jgi:hypothetical protein